MLGTCCTGSESLCYRSSDLKNRFLESVCRVSDPVFAQVHGPVLVTTELFCGHLPYSKAVILPPQPQPIAIIFLSFSQPFLNFFHKQSKTTKQSLDLCTPSKVQNTLTQGSLYCKSSCYPCHLPPHTLLTTLLFPSHPSNLTQPSKLKHSVLFLQA